MSAPTMFKFEKFEGNGITDTILEAAAELFSNNYGVWGVEAASRIGAFAKPGRRESPKYYLYQSHDW